MSFLQSLILLFQWVFSKIKSLTNFNTDDMVSKISGFENNKLDTSYLNETTETEWLPVQDDKLMVVSQLLGVSCS